MGSGNRWICGLLAGVLILLGGCQRSLFNGFLDPSEVGRFSGPNVNQNIRNVLSIMDEPLEVAEATDPTPEDLQPIFEDYVLGPGDVVDISIFELMAEGIESVFRRQVSETGYITIPVLGSVKLAGLTGMEAEQHLAEKLREEEILREPRVSVTIMERRHQLFHMLGGFGAPGTYAITKPDFRLLDALAMARDIQPGVETIYVIRPYEKQAAGPAEQGAASAEDVQAAELADVDRGEPIATEAELESVLGGPAAATEPGGGAEAAPKLIYVNGEWVEVPAAAASEPAQTRPVSQPATAPSEWEEAVGLGLKQRIIQIPVQDLLRGDHRYNIVVRPGDKIYAWIGPVGEFYVTGHVLRPGTYSLTGRRITLRQAIAAAGGLGPLAWPSRCELIRRHSNEQEEIIQLDLDAIFAGTQPDVLLKPNDVINVGTHPVAPFMATVRNAFRMTYGFGFVYDRNFADIDSFNPQVNPRDRRRAERATRFGGLFR